MCPHDAHLDHEQDRVEVNEVQRHDIVEHEAQQAIGDDVEDDRQLGPDRRHAAREQPDDYDPDGRDVVEAGEDAHNLPQGK